ncbi:hypothetical protein [Paenibacillus pinistramenti]|uniref:hypothetical protein n=1 Tax=Paenibacillus pinistramenti TaxID=1768003 RepID=UPI001396CC48|nr:hypothetical protein [Paenibacillus pinistramenti]
MNKALRSEQGSALVLVMFVALLLTILGLAILGATLSGAQRTETRESDVQSLHLAQKGLDEATAYIESKLAGMTDINPDRLEELLSTINLNNLNVTTELGTIGNNANGEIQEIKYSGKEAVTSVSQPSRKYYIDVTTSAVVNGVSRKLKQRITLDTYPDFLKYAFGSEQQLRLNGAPLLKGNIYAGDRLVVTNQAEYSYKGTSFHTGTLFPTVQPFGISAGEVHVQSWGGIQYANGLAAPSGSSPLIPLQQGDAKTDEILGVTPDKVKIKEEKKFVQINVEESFWDKLVEAVNPSTTIQAENIREELRDQYAANSLNDWLVKNSSIRHLKKPALPVKESISADDDAITIAAKEQRYQDAVKVYKDTLDTQLGSSAVPFSNSAVFDEDLTIDNMDYQRIMFSDQAKTGTASAGGSSGSSPAWLVVAGNLTIDNYNTDDFLSIKGNLLVTGNLTIRGSVAFDSTVFVLGKTTAEDAAIQGLNGKELIVISKQEILLTRIESFSNTAQEMKAFFYTDSSGELYGVGSIFKLNGGFFAKGDLTVNAVVGNVQPPAAAGSGFVFQQPQATGMDPRFIVEYNNAIYTDQQASLPRVKTVSMSVSPVELVGNQ